MPTYIRPPDSLPLFRVNPHGFQEDRRYAILEHTTGHRRRRRVCTAGPRTYDVAWQLSSDQMADLHAWFENTLLVGERTFLATVRTESGLQYWEAAWVQPYVADPFPVSADVHWRVTGSIITFGDPTAEAPFTNELAAENGLALEIEVTVTRSAELAAENGLALERVQTLAAENGLALERFVPELFITEDDQLIVNEDGSGDGFQTEDT